LKGDYGIWKKLINHQTGIGGDESHKNIVMTEAWWKKMANVSVFHKGHLYFSL
jgi:hypothetical protein